MEIIFELAESLWGYQLSFIPVFVVLNVFVMQIGGVLFGMGFTGYLKTPAEFELHVKESLAISHVAHEKAMSMGYSSDDVGEMLEKLYADGNDLHSPPDDWGYETDPVEIYKQANNASGIIPLHPVTKESQVWWMKLGAFILLLSAILPLLAGQAIAIPMFVAVFLGYLVFVYGFKSFGMNNFERYTDQFNSNG